MEEGALLRLDDGGRLDAKEGSLQHLVKASPRRYGSIAILHLASSLGPLRPASASTERALPFRFAAHPELIEVINAIKCNFQVFIYLVAQKQVFVANENVAQSAACSQRLTGAEIEGILADDRAIR